MALVRQVPEVELFVSNQTSPDTRRAYRYDLVKWMSWLGDRMPDPATVVEFRQWLEANHSPRTAARVFNTCRSFYKFLGSFNPFANIRSPRRLRNATPSVPEDALVQRMLDLCDDPRDRLIISLLLNGLRASEVADLGYDSINWEPQYGCDIIRVVGKGFKQRFVPATLETSRSLRAYWRATQRASERLIDGRDGLPLTLRRVEYVVEKWSEAAGTIIRPHKLRHHYATRLARSNISVFALKDLLGHESVATTQVYVSMSLDDIVREAGRDPMNVVMEVSSVDG